MSHPEKENNKSIAKENAEIFLKGYYSLSDGSKISLKTELNFSVQKSIYLKDSNFLEIDKQLTTPAKNRQTKLEITGESTFQAAKRLRDETGENVVVLNFASATNQVLQT